jgi:hypothetical protein
MLLQQQGRPGCHDRDDLRHGSGPHLPAGPVLVDPVEPRRGGDDERAERGDAEADAEHNGIQCPQITSRTAMMTPPTAFTMNAGPTTWACRNTSNQRYRWIPAETRTATAASIRSFKALSGARSRRTETSSTVGREFSW